MSTQASTLLTAAGLAALGGAACFAYTHGLFTSVSPEEETVGPWLCVYTQYAGAYHGAFKAMHRVAGLVTRHTQWDGAGLRWLGAYFDQPRDTPPEACRASLGVLLPADGSEQELRALADGIAQQPWAADNGLKVCVLPASRVVAVQLPFYGLLSVVVGIWRAYGKLQLAAAAANQGSDAKTYGSLEIYDRATRTMRICFPLDVRAVLLPFDLPKP